MMNSSARAAGPLRWVSATRSCRASAPDGGLFVPERLPAMPWSELPVGHRVAGIAAQVIAPFAEGDPLAARARRHLPGGIRLSRSARAPRAGARPCLASSSCFTVRRARSRISARASSRLRSRDCTDRAGTQGRPSSSRRRATRAELSPRPSTAVRGSTSSFCIRRGSCRRGRRSSSPAGARTSVRLRSAAHSTTASAWSRRPCRIAALAAAHRLSSANSINLGRLLPQMVYYAAASLEIWQRERTQGRASSCRPAISAT